MASTELTIHMDEVSRDECEAILNDLGISMATGFNMFVKAVVRHKGVPFELRQNEEELDPFWNPYNQARLRESIRQAEAGNVIIKTAEELGLDEVD